MNFPEDPKTVEPDLPEGWKEIKYTSSGHTYYCKGNIKQWRKPEHKCTTCQTTKDVFWTYCPYTLEIGNTFVYEHFCPTCHYETCMDI